MLTISDFLQGTKNDAINFDPEFTEEDPVMTPINSELVDNIDQSEFKGFSYYSTKLRN